MSRPMFGRFFNTSEEIISPLRKQESYRNCEKQKERQMKSSRGLDGQGRNTEVGRVPLGIPKLHK
ncbi:hypothetical protein [Emticicia oligotrophica]|uniref:hypothetical protein n=1 Tax=Emticicia oligotrophica TaxID=312279 RepID=UPI00273B823F|nr:hypothetical protein [Emticicia oligotrophica]